LQAGVLGYMLKSVPASDLAQVIRLAHRGIYQFDPAAIARLRPAVAEAGAKQNAAQRLSQLTEREREILRLVARGDTNRQIAAQLFISEGTVKNHISNILTRLNLSDRTQAAVFAALNA
jgi:DNA-binding NarL/FixJ family response regulator